MGASTGPAPELVQSVAGNEYNLGVLLSDTGRADEALVAYRRSLALRRRLARDYPGRPEHRLDLAYTLGNMAACAIPADLAAAEAEYREAVGILSELAAAYPKASAVRAGLARNRLNLAIVLLDRGDGDGAAACCRENVRADPRDAGARRNWRGRSGCGSCSPGSRACSPAPRARRPRPRRASSPSCAGGRSSSGSGPPPGCTVRPSPPTRAGRGYGRRPPVRGRPRPPPAPPAGTGTTHPPLRKRGPLCAGSSGSGWAELALRQKEGDAPNAAERSSRPTRSRPG
ncbi:hypothetical protein FTUN_7915 [Frigoriglobus tundricola]|uniref:Tetratricopeptide repeat protein n=2 Tax=Frigoriglobus tundricola TaxID=2774151 RepID=A0A6M5Z1P4_9BACT|nr:hypothetical protein FTUN_7915 [Frigoriglobus tundricola]